MLAKVLCPSCESNLSETGDILFDIDECEFVIYCNECSRTVVCIPRYAFEVAKDE